MVHSTLHATPSRSCARLTSSCYIGHHGVVPRAGCDRGAGRGRAGRDIRTTGGAAADSCGAVDPGGVLRFAAAHREGHLSSGDALGRGGESQVPDSATGPSALYAAQRQHHTA